ncbi:MAG: PqqD family protein [Chloroflexi bacterium]|nr:PqqD family protein [Chloroflexota bacterium]
MTTLNARIYIPEETLFNEVGEETILVNLTNGNYFTLDEVGTHMWQLMSQHNQLMAVHQSLLEEYSVDSNQLEQDLLVFVDKLAASKLLQIVEP